jgi:hypothetical protein
MGFSATGLARLAGLSRRTLTFVVAGRISSRTLAALRVPLRLTTKELAALARGEIPLLLLVLVS